MGYDNFAGWGEETAWATEVARTQFARVYEDSSAAHEIPRNPVEFIGGRDPDTLFDGIQRGTMNINVPLVYDGVGVMLYHAMGQKSVSGAGPYIHIFSLDDLPYTRVTTPLVGLSAEIHAGLNDTALESWTLEGGRVRNFTFNFTSNEEVKASFDLVGKQVKQDAKTASPTFPAYAAATSDLVIPSQITVEFDDGASTVVHSAEITVANNLRDDKAFLGSQYIGAPTPNGRREITGTLSKEWEDNTLYAAFLAGTVVKLEVICTGPGNLDYTFLLPQVRFTGGTPALVPTEEIDQELPFVAYEDATDGAFKITNNTDSAAP